MFLSIHSVAAWVSLGCLYFGLMTRAVRYAVASVSDDNAASFITDAVGNSAFQTSLSTHHSTTCHNPEVRSVNLLTCSLLIN
jgi:hypothetical protein